jgi:hypothetical protein
MYKQIFLLIAAINILTCTAPEMKQEPVKIKFAVLGNTMPDSPFNGYPEYLQAVMKDIKEENPVLLIHTGNIATGGSDWNGINSKDLERQYDYVIKTVSQTAPLFYTSIGEKDLFNEKPDIYRYNFKKDLNYSFNYGNIHFIVFDTAYSYKINPEETFNWLKSDLEKNRNSQAIFIISHFPFINLSYDCGPVNNGNKLMELIKEFPVKAVISGCIARYKTIEEKGIFHVVPGCGSYTKEEKYKRFNHYIIFNYDGINLNIKNKEIKLTFQ